MDIGQIKKIIEESVDEEKYLVYNGEYKVVDKAHECNVCGHETDELLRF